MENKSIPTYPEPIPAPPERYECNDALTALLENLRSSQRQFFASQPGTLLRQSRLQESKRLEKELDAFLQARKAKKADTQTKLFKKNRNHDTD